MKTKQYWVGFAIALLAGTVATLQVTGVVSGDAWFFMLTLLLLGLAWFLWIRAKAGNAKGMNPGVLAKYTVAVFMAAFALLCVPALRALAPVPLFAAIISVPFILEGIQWVAMIATKQAKSSGRGKWLTADALIVLLAFLGGLAMIVSCLLSLIAAFGGPLSETYVLWQPAVCLLADAVLMLVPLLIGIRGQRNVKRIIRDIKRGR